VGRSREREREREEGDESHLFCPGEGARGLRQRRRSPPRSGLLDGGALARGRPSLPRVPERRELSISIGSASLPPLISARFLYSQFTILALVLSSNLLSFPLKLAWGGALQCSNDVPKL
jgi:hypothetical protein